LESLSKIIVAPYSIVSNHILKCLPNISESNIALNRFYILQIITAFISSSVLDPDPPGYEIIWSQGTGSRSKIIDFGSGSFSLMFLNVLKSILKNHYDYTINTLTFKFKKLRILIHLCLHMNQPTNFFSPSLINRRIRIQLPDFHFEDPDLEPKLIISDPEH